MSYDNIAQNAETQIKSSSIGSSFQECNCLASLSSSEMRSATQTSPHEGTTSNGATGSNDPAEGTSAADRGNGSQSEQRESDMINYYDLPGGDQLIFNNYWSPNEPGEPRLRIGEEDHAVVKSQQSTLADGRIMITQTFQNGAQGEYIQGVDMYTYRSTSGMTVNLQLSKPDRIIVRCN